MNLIQMRSISGEDASAVPASNGGGALHVTRSNAASTVLDFGTTAGTTTGSLAAGYTGSSSSVAFTGLTPLANYLLCFSWIVNAAQSVDVLVPLTITVGTGKLLYPNQAGLANQNSVHTAPNPVGNLSKTMQKQFTITSTAGGLITVTTTGGGITGAVVWAFNLWVIPIDVTIT
jgi:hypothetical protein